MKFWNMARICLAIYDFKAHIVLGICLTFQGNQTTARKQFSSIMWLRSLNLFLVISIDL